MISRICNVLMITSSYRNHEILSFSKDNLVICKWIICDIYVLFEVGWCRICLRIAEDSDPHLCLVIAWYKNVNSYNCLKIKNKMCIICFWTIQQSGSERFDLTIGIVWDVTYFFYSDKEWMECIYHRGEEEGKRSMVSSHFISCVNNSINIEKYCRVIWKLFSNICWTESLSPPTAKLYCGVTEWCIALPSLKPLCQVLKRKLISENWEFGISTI